MFACLSYLCSSQTFYRKMITVLRLVATPSCRKIAIRIYNNLRINWLTNLWLSIFPDKWRLNTSKDWEILGEDFDSVSLKTISDATLRALGFHNFPLSYLEEGPPWFVNTTDKPELAIKPKDNNQPITNSEDEKARKRYNAQLRKKHGAIIFVLLCSRPLLLALQLFFRLVLLFPLCRLVLLCPICRLPLCLLRLILLGPLCRLLLSSLCCLLLCPLCRLLLWPLCHLFICPLCFLLLYLLFRLVLYSV